MENKEHTIEIKGKEYTLTKNSISIYRDNYELFELLENPLTEDDRKNIQEAQKEFRKEVAAIKKEAFDIDMEKELIGTQKELYDAIVSSIRTRAYLKVMDEEKLRQLIQSVVVGGEDIDWKGSQALEVMVEIFEQVKKHVAENEKIAPLRKEMEFLKKEYEKNRKKDKNASKPHIRKIPEIPENWTYEFMISFLARQYGQCKYHIADNYTRYDFYEEFLIFTYEKLGE